MATSSSAKRFRIRQAYQPFVIRVLLGFLASLILAVVWLAIGVTPRFAPLLGWLIYIPPIIAAFIPYRPEVVVGTDGVSFRVRGKDRFVSYRDLSGAYIEDRQVVLQGRTPIGTPPSFWVKESEDLVDAINDGIQAFEEAGPDRLPTALARKDETLLAWRDRLAARAQERSYRDAAVAPLLVRVVENPANPIDVRAVAAQALARGDDAHRAKVRVVAEETAEPELRQALARSAEGKVSDRSLRKVGGSARRTPAKS
ncbi:MAG: hypothetical protein AAGF12_41520 [Myxococcota bacterium]